ADSMFNFNLSVKIYRSIVDKSTEKIEIYFQFGIKIIFSPLFTHISFRKFRSTTLFHHSTR
ncbi:hypothetical protein, partial [Phocaeicola coprocola]|uniref:hypothetical protein n=1 Tax=Phocaeicola coprocola TaxID=310298 RepID=UPI0026DCC1AF